MEEVKEQLLHNWPAGGYGVGVSRLVESFSAHFGQREMWKAFHEQCWNHPSAGTLYCQMDFAEHHTLPFGPEVPGSSWYADQVMGVTWLGAITWFRDGDTPRRTCRNFLTKAKDQSSAFATFSLGSAVAAARLGDGNRFQRLVVLCDSGRHFQSCAFIAFCMEHLPEAYPRLEEVELMFAPAGHGKGPCDAEFGHAKSFRAAIGMRHHVNTPEQYVRRLTEHSEALYDIDKSRNHREFILSDLPRRGECLLASYVASDILRQVDLGVSGIPLWRSRPRRGWAAVGLRPTVSVHMSPEAPVIAPLDPVLVEPTPEEKSVAWQFYYRVTNPESFRPSMRTALKWALTPNRWLAVRHTPKHAQRRRDELVRAVARARQQRQLAADRRQRLERQAMM